MKHITPVDSPSPDDVIIDVMESDADTLASSLLAILPLEILQEIVQFLDAPSLRNLLSSNKQLAEYIFAGYQPLDFSLSYVEKINMTLISSHEDAFFKYGFTVFECYLNKPLEEPPLNPFLVLGTLMAESLNQQKDDCRNLILLKGMLLIGLMVSLFLLVAGESPSWSLAAILPALLGLTCYLHQYYQEYRERLVQYNNQHALQEALPNDFALIDRYAPLLASAAEKNALFERKLANFYQVYRDTLKLKDKDFNHCFFEDKKVETANGSITAKHIVCEKIKVGRWSFFERLRQETELFPNEAEQSDVPCFSRLRSEA